MSGYPRQNTKMHPLEIGIKLAFSPKCMSLSFKKIKNLRHKHSGRGDQFIWGKIKLFFKSAQTWLKLEFYYKYEVLETTYKKFSKIAT